MAPPPPDWINLPHERDDIASDSLHFSISSIDIDYSSFFFLTKMTTIIFFWTRQVDVIREN